MKRLKIEWSTKSKAPGQPWQLANSFNDRWEDMPPDPSIEARSTTNAPSWLCTMRCWQPSGPCQRTSESKAKMGCAVASGMILYDIICQVWRTRPFSVCHIIVCVDSCHWFNVLVHIILWYTVICIRYDLHISIDIPYMYADVTLYTHIISYHIPLHYSFYIFTYFKGFLAFVLWYSRFLWYLHPRSDKLLQRRHLFRWLWGSSLQIEYLHSLHGAPTRVNKRTSRVKSSLASRSFCSLPSIPFLSCNECSLILRKGILSSHC